MISRAALVLSTLASAALLTLWLRQYPRDVPTPPPRAADARLPEAVAPVAGDLDRWLAMGLSEHEAKRLLFATLEERALAGLANPWVQFWQSGDPGARYALALMQAYAGVRDALVHAVGAEAAQTPEFSRAFRPLDAQFAFLSGPEQIELQRRRLNALEQHKPAVVGAASADTSRRDVAAGSLAVALEFLAPAAAFEVALRDSPRAAQLRRSGAALDEYEFREAFALLERADTIPDVAVQVDTRRRLRALLGPQRFTAVAAVRDPLFGLVERVGQAYGLEAAAVAAAYEVLSDAQSQLLDLAVARPDGERAAAATAQIAAAERERLAAAVGDEPAAAIHAAREEFYVGARQAAMTAGGASTP